MPGFTIGTASVGLAAAFAVSYLGYVCLRFTYAWIARSKPPQERILVVTLLAAVAGFIAGSLLQPSVDLALQCRAEGKPVVPCAFLSQQQH